MLRAAEIGYAGVVLNPWASLFGRKLLPAVCLLMAPGTLLADGNSEWFARPWESYDGLPNNTVQGIAQTPDGYLWLGTPSGLVRFDGVHFDEIASTNFIAPPNNGIVTMIASRSGALWLAMDRGAVVCLDGAESRFYGTNLPNFIPNGLAEDGDRNVWIAYRGGSVYRIRQDKITPMTTREGLPEGTDICAMTTDTRGRFWWAKAGQLGVYRDGAFQKLREFEAAPARLAVSSAGGVWLCAGFHLFKVDENGKLQEAGGFHAEQSGTIPTAMIEDRQGAVWVGTTFSGLFRHDQDGFQSIPTTHQEILSLTEDHEGNIWVGTVGGGLNRVRRRSVTLEGTSEGLPYPSVQSMCEDTSGTIWVATQNGILARRISGRWSALPTEENGPADATCLTSGRDGSLWLGTRLRGLYQWRNGTFKHWGEAEGVRGQTLHTLLVSRNGDLWMGEETPHAIQRLRDGKLKTFEVSQDVRIIRAMAEDAEGTIWAGSSKGNLLRIAGDQLTDVTPRPQQLASIRCLNTTADGALWIGFAGWGLGRLKDGVYGEVHADQGFADNYISHIVPDEHGWLWFGANRGLFKARQAELEAVMEGRATRVRCLHYGRSEGLPSLQANFGDSPDSLRSSDGRLWIPMRTYLAVVDPEKPGDNREPPQTLLTQVSVDDRLAAWYRGVLPGSKGQGKSPVELGSPDVVLRLPPNHRRLEFEFAALSFTAPENVQFRYRLENSDDEWVEAGNKRSAGYLRLPYGNYLFRVTACNQDGVWNKTGAMLTVIVMPFFWQTWTFRISVLTGFTLSLAALVRYLSFRRLRERLRLLEQQAALHKERARIAKDIHDDLGANLTQIALLGELAQQDRGEPERAAERMGKISGTARQAIKSLDEIVWAVNPRNDTLAHLIDYTGQFAVDYLRLAGIRCRLDLPDQTPQRELSTDLRHNLFLVVKEALNNIVKHSRASEVWLRATASEQGLSITVEDDGCGFDHVPDNALSDGLRNMRQRMTDIGGTFEIQSKPRVGTKVLLHLPWPGSS